MSNIKTNSKMTGMEIAVIGMAGRFPGSKNLDEFWNNLKEGKETIHRFTDEELIEAGVNKKMIKHPQYVNAYGRMPDVEYFDAPYFGYSPREAEAMHPQTRLLHENVVEALDQAGYAPESTKAPIGLYLGGTTSFNWESKLFFSGAAQEMGEYEASHFADKDVASLRISYNLNLKGPSYALQTTCSTSLVAVHVACRSLLTGECKIAVAGGATVSAERDQGYLYQDGMIISSDGHCRAFDADADGTVPGEGVGIVVLKRLKNAIDDGDTIHAIIKGTSCNNDGKRKAGFTAPSVEGQVDVIKSAIKMAKIDPESIGYMEAHGTGTNLGDPIEIEALTLAFGSKNKNYCKLGSVKTNIGHCDTASGIAGFIKTVLTVKNGLIPPSLHFNKPNPEIDFLNSPFEVNTELTKWDAKNNPRRAAVSSLGVGGTNVHAIVEEAPFQPESTKDNDRQLLLLSANSEYSLEKMTEELADYIAANPDIKLADIAYTLQVGRKLMSHRRAIAVDGREDAIEKLKDQKFLKLNTFCEKEDKRQVVFMFSGQGSQYSGMAKELIKSEPTFKEELTKCADIFNKVTGKDLFSLISEQEGEAALEINETVNAQPLLFSIEYAMAKMVMNYGIKPYAMIGHSLGEYVAATLSGLFSLEEALEIVAKRAELMQGMDAGSMVTVMASEEEIIELLPEKLSIAAINSSTLTVVSGEDASIEELCNTLSEREIDYKRLKTSHAFHSEMTEAILPDFKSLLDKFSYNKPEMPYISNLSGTWIKADEVMGADYWLQHMRGTVQFNDGLSTLLKEENLIFLELGPGNTLCTFVRQNKSKTKNHQVVNMLPHPNENKKDYLYAISKLGQLWSYSQKLDWNQLHGEVNRKRVHLPAYPFDRKKFWVDGDIASLTAEMFSGDDPNKKIENIDEWFYMPSWKRLKLAPSLKEQTLPKLLVFTNGTDDDNLLIDRLKEQAKLLVEVEAGEHYNMVDDYKFTIAKDAPESYKELFDNLDKSGLMPDVIIHLWSYPALGNIEDNLDGFDEIQYNGLYSLLYISQALATFQISQEVLLSVVSTELHDVTGDENLVPAKSLLLSPLKTVPQEYPNFIFKSIDLDRTFTKSAENERAFDKLIIEMLNKTPDRVISYRNGNRWVQTFEKVLIGEEYEALEGLRNNGVYIITGGLGGVGLILARYLARVASAKLVLTGRSQMPPREEWDEWLNTHKKSDTTSNKIRKIKEIEELGGTVLPMTADVSDKAAMEQLFLKTEEEFGTINGVIHAAAESNDKSSYCLMDELTKELCEEQFIAKINGLLILNDLFKEREIDFCLITSSISTVLGGLGFLSYVASNLYVDYFVNKKVMNNETHWITVNWDGWELGGTSHSLVDLGDDESEFERDTFIEAEEGEKVLQRLLTWNFANHMIVSTRNLQSKLDLWVNMNSLSDDDEKQNIQYQGRPELKEEYVAPRNDKEKIMAEIWQNMLAIDQIGINDNFFELGGDSLKMITISSRMHKALEVKVPIGEFFNYPTIAELYEYISSIGKTKYDSILPAEEKDYYPLSSAQKRIYLLQQLDPIGTSYNITDFYEFENRLDKDKLELAFKKIIKRHDSFRTAFVEVDGEPMQKILDDIPFKLEHLQMTKDEITKKSEEFIKTFDLSQAPLFRVALIDNIDTDGQVLMLDFHHIITDGVSFNIFTQELFALYKGEELPPIRLQYKDYSEWHNNQKVGGVIKKQEEYWLSQFETAPLELNLPTDYERPKLLNFQGKKENFLFDQELTERLKNIAKEQGTTLFVLLLTMYNIFLTKVSAQEDICVGIPVAGRKHDDLQNIMGMFVNTLVIRTFPNPEISFIDFLSEVNKKSIDAFENQDYQLEELVEKVLVNRKNNRNPLFDVLFSVQNFNPEDNSAFSELKTPDTETNMVADNRTSKFDITLICFESSNKLPFMLEYNTELFSENTIKQFIKNFREIVETITAKLDIKIKDISLSTDIKKAKVEQVFTDFSF